MGWHAFTNRAKHGEYLILGYARFGRVLSDFAISRVLPFDEVAADVYSGLKTQKLRVGEMDLRIASIAIANGMTLLLRNTVDFHRMPGLQLEDWTTSPR